MGEGGRGGGAGGRGEDIKGREADIKGRETGEERALYPAFTEVYRCLLVTILDVFWSLYDTILQPMEMPLTLSQSMGRDIQELARR